MQTKSQRLIAGATLIAAALGLSACTGYGPSYGTQAVGGTGSAAYSTYGTVTNVQYMAGGSGLGNYAGAAIGAVVGGVGASQYALRNDKDRRYSTAIGAFAGALVGEAIQQNTSGVARSGQPFYRMTVRLDSGETRTFDYQQSPEVAIGTRVRVEGNQVYR